MRWAYLVGVLLASLLVWTASARVGLIGPGGGAPPPPASSGWTAVNGTDKSTSVDVTTTTSTNDTASQSTTVSSFRMVRGTQPYATGKKVFTLKVQSVDSGGGWIGGVADNVTPVSNSTSQFPGSYSKGAGFQAGTGARTYQDNGGATNTVCANDTAPVFVAGDTMWIAIDFATGFMNCSKDCVSWLGGFKPDQTGTVGRAVALAAGTYYPAWAGGHFPTGGDIAIINTSPSFTVPVTCSGLAGFSQWG